MLLLRDIVVRDVHYVQCIFGKSFSQLRPESLLRFGELCLAGRLDICPETMEIVINDPA